MTYIAEMDTENPLASLQAGSCTYRIALRARRTEGAEFAHRARPGQKTTTGLCAGAHGFSVHAGLRRSEHQRKEFERLCRYIARSVIANERLKRNGAGDVVLQLKNAWRDGPTHIKMSPLEFMQRLAALVPAASALCPAQNAREPGTLIPA
jgi:hypothetical protein